MTDVTVVPVEKTDELFCHYPGRAKPQPAHVQLDLEDGELLASHNAEVGEGMPASVFLGRALRWDIPILTADAANRLLDGLVPLAQRIVDGATIEWNGNDHIGRLDDDARAAADDIQALCSPQSGHWDESAQVCEFDAADWVADTEEETVTRLGLTADSTDTDIDAMEAAEMADAAENPGNYGAVILVGFADWLWSRRTELREQVADDLEETARQLADLEEKRNAAVRRMVAWGPTSGWSTRTIATLVGRSHNWVRTTGNMDPASDTTSDTTGDTTEGHSPE